jgi:tripartite-type tricarboxylate transporter receptor subunit TctC
MKVIGAQSRCRQSGNWATVKMISAAVLLAASLCLPTQRVSAEPYPSRPIQMVLGFPPGASTDLSARALANFLAKALGTAVVVVNRPGASGQIGTESVKRADPDGYTILYGTDSFLLSQLKGVPVNYTTEDFFPVARVRTSSIYLAFNSKVPANGIAEFIALTKANPGKFTYASGGVGSILNIAGEAFKIGTGADLTHIPYNGGTPALADVVAGRVDVIIAGADGIKPFVDSGSLKPLVMTGETVNPSMPAFPPLPTIVPGVSLTTWHGIFAPKAIPDDIRKKLVEAVKAVAESEEFFQAIQMTGAEKSEIIVGQQFSAFLKEREYYYRQLIKQSGMTLN